jgi:hypothetical protein
MGVHALHWGVPQIKTFPHHASANDYIPRVNQQTLSYNNQAQPEDVVRLKNYPDV